MSAKISDLGVAKIVNLSPSQMTQLVQTKAPGTPCYMPPEALTSRPKYNTKIDVYSMGVMLIHVFCGEGPFPTDAFQPDPRNPDSLVPVTEVERRAKFLRKIGDDHPLTLLMRHCLSNNPTLCPDVAQICAQLTEVKSQFLAMAETRIDFIQQLQSSQDEVVAVRKALEEQALGKEELEMFRKQLSSVSLRGSAESTVFTCNTEEVQLLHPLSKLQWRRCADMPVGKFRVQAVVIGDEVYVGGGLNDDTSFNRFVVKYNITKDEWTRLPDHCVALFSLCQFQGNLVSVGGTSRARPTKKVCHSSSEDRKWVESLKLMPTARAYPILLTTSSAIIACGGMTNREDGKVVATATVEVYSSTTSQWHTADPLPQPCVLMTAATISGCGFLLGGATAIKTPIKSLFCVDMATLIDRATFSTRHHETTPTWKTLPDTPLLGS